jgi:hypothetical protein
MVFGRPRVFEADPLRRLDDCDLIHDAAVLIAVELG